MSNIIEALESAEEVKKYSKHGGEGMKVNWWVVGFVGLVLGAVSAQIAIDPVTLVDICK